MAISISNFRKVCNYLFIWLIVCKLLATQLRERKEVDRRYFNAKEEDPRHIFPGLQFFEFFRYNCLSIVDYSICLLLEMPDSYVPNVLLLVSINKKNSLVIWILVNCLSCWNLNNLDNMLNSWSYMATLGKNFSYLSFT